MKTLQSSTELNHGLERVGLKGGERVEIGSDAVAETWMSDYAELYLVDATALTKGDMSELLSRLDSVVAKRLRQQRELGRFLDAHVCIMLPDNLIQDAELAQESDASRYVSRKYWINRDSPVEEILRRLTLTWVDVDTQSPEAGSQHLEEFSDLRKRIADRMGAGAASDFLLATAK